MFDTLVNFCWDRLPLVLIDGKEVRTTSPYLYERLRSECPGVSREEFCRTFVDISRSVQERRNRDHQEISARERFSMLFSRLGVPAGLGADRLLDAALSEHMRQLACAMEFPESHRTALDRLRSRYRLGLISNFDYTPTVEATLVAEKIRDRFETVVVSADIGWCKPRPEIFAEALGRMGLLPSEAVFVGDTPESDVLGAQGVGLDVIWIDRGTAPLPVGTPPPLRIISNFAEVADLL